MGADATLVAAAYQAGMAGVPKDHSEAYKMVADAAGAESIAIT